MALVFWTTNFVDDISPYAHAITRGGTPTVGYRMETDGAADYENIDPVIATVGGDTAGSWFAWVNPTDATPVANEWFINFGDTAANEIIAIAILTTGIFYAACIDGGAVAWVLETDAAAFLDGAWTRIGIVHNGTQPTLYADGAATAQTFSTDNDRTIWFSDCAGLDNGRLGCQNYNGGGNLQHFDGIMADVRIYNDAKSADWVAIDYQRTKKFY